MCSTTKPGGSNAHQQLARALTNSKMSFEAFATAAALKFKPDETVSSIAQLATQHKRNPDSFEIPPYIITYMKGFIGKQAAKLSRKPRDKSRGGSPTHLVHQAGGTAF